MDLKCTTLYNSIIIIFYKNKKQKPPYVFIILTNYSYFHPLLNIINYLLSIFIYPLLINIRIYIYYLLL